MYASKLIRHTSAACASILLAACNGSLAGVSRTYPASVIPASSASGDLIYATGYSDSNGGEVFMLTYPQGQLVGSIGTGAQGVCSDTNGNVYVLYRNAAIEYAHGSTTPIKSLRIPGAETFSCAVDPTTNDVAVTFDCPPCGYQDLAIFPNGTGTAIRYSTPNYYSCTYDNQGNLFLAGGGGAGISELPRGSGSFTNITLSQDLGSGGQVQWDGKYVTLETVQSPAGIYRIQISGSSGTVVGETKFGRYMRRVGYSWIAASDGAVIVPFSEHGATTNILGVWKYPKGGKAMKIIKGIGIGNHGFGSVTVSVAPTR